MESIQRHKWEGSSAIRAVASPARLELLSALGAGPSTTQELAHRLGRSRQSLYYHLGLLEQAGLVVVDTPADGQRERQFRLARERLAAAANRDSTQDRRAASDAIRAILRLTAREASAALEDPAMRFEGALRQLVSFRGKARLAEAQLRRANELIDELEALLGESNGGSTADPLYAVTLVLTPARDAGDSESDG